MTPSLLRMTELILGFILLGAALLLLLALLYRTIRQALAARALAIRTPNGIQEGRFVQIGERKEWVQIRGEDRNNPILLFLHGGPGVANSPLTALFRAWERDFTVVQWDQPGAGKTASRNGKRGYQGLTVNSMVDDGVQVAEWALRRLGQRRLIILGTSWGSLLGIQIVKRRPGLALAYVGVGQFVDGEAGQRAGYELALTRARTLSKSETLKTLEQVGPPPYADSKTSMLKQRALGQVDLETEGGRRMPNILAAALFAPGYSLRDTLAYLQGMPMSIETFERSIMSHDLRPLGMDFDVPLFFLQGARDIYTPAAPVQEYVATLRAPRKELVVWDDEGHLTFLTNPEKIHGELLARVRPVASKALVADGATPPGPRV
ncbi:MAG TPA: alpha/beta hydrolase [Ktedonobacterales bacterium]